MIRANRPVPPHLQSNEKFIEYLNASVTVGLNAGGRGVPPNKDLPGHHPYIQTYSKEHSDVTFSEKRELQVRGILTDNNVGNSKANTNSKGGSGGSRSAGIKPSAGFKVGGSKCGSTLSSSPQCGSKAVVNSKNVNLIAAPSHKKLSKEESRGCAYEKKRLINANDQSEWKRYKDGVEENLKMRTEAMIGEIEQVKRQLSAVLRRREEQIRKEGERKDEKIGRIKRMIEIEAGCLEKENMVKREIAERKRAGMGNAHGGGGSCNAHGGGGKDGDRGVSDRGVSDRGVSDRGVSSGKDGRDGTSSEKENSKGGIRSSTTAGAESVITKTQSGGKDTSTKNDATVDTTVLRGETTNLMRGDSSYKVTPGSNLDHFGHNSLKRAVRGQRLLLKDELLGTSYFLLL
jgi:hypothetical protein